MKKSLLLFFGVLMLDVAGWAQNEGDWRTRNSGLWNGIIFGRFIMEELGHGTYDCLSYEST